MGHEYIIRLRDSDIDALSRDPRGTTTLQKLLQEVPCYKSMRAPNHFFYSSDEDREPGWYSSVLVEGNKLLLCSYATADFQDIAGFLFRRLLELCGHFEIKDA